MDGTTQESNAASAAATEQPSSQPPPRLMITKMRMENFKSYYGVQEVGEFHHCFSSVVGPNGSGKSNVIDALLFVFGKRAKQIRQGKLKDLIHNSENHLNLESCKVSVFFQDIVDLPGGGFETVPGTEIVVSREAFRSGGSSYRVDGKTKTWKEVGDLLRHRGIDLDHNRFLILQGEVEQIALMKPKAIKETNDDGLLEYLEDIIGSDRFKIDIEEAEKCMEELNEKRNEKLNRVKVVEAEKDELETGKREAEECLAQQNSLTIKKSKLYQCYLHESRQNVAVATEKRTGIAEESESARVKVTEGEENMKAMEKKHSKDNKEFKSLEKAVDKTKADFAVFERKDIQHHQDLKHSKTKEKKLNKLIQKNKTAKATQEGDLESTEGQTVKLQKELESKQKSLIQEEQNLEKMEEGLKGERAEKQQELEKKQTELQPHSALVNEAQSIYDVKKTELDMKTQNHRNITNQLEEKVEILEKAKDTLENFETTIDTKTKHRAQIEKELKQATKELADISQREGPMDEKVRCARSAVEDNKANTNNVLSRGKVLDTIMEQSRKGKLRGICGRLGDLGTIDDKYDCAVTTACGALNNIVVETVEDAQAAINFLKKNKIGRATFIPLNKIENLRKRAEEPFQSPIPRLVDLIKMKDDKYKTAFYKGLHNTLVANHLDEATKVAYGGKTRQRVVTVQGQLIDSSGTMSGGGNKPRKGGMSSKPIVAMSQAEIKAMEQALEKDFQKLQGLRKRRAELERAVHDLKKELNQLDTDIKKNQLDLESAEKQIEDLPAQIEELKVKQADSKQELKGQDKLEKELAKLEKNLEKAKAAAGKVEAEIAAIEEEIENIGGIKLKAQKSKVEGIQEQIATIQSNITKANVGMKTARRGIEKLTKQIAKDEAEVAATKEHIETIKEEFKNIETEAAEVMKAYKLAEEKLKEKEEDMKDIKGEYSALKATLTELRKVQVDLDHQLEEYDRVLKDNQSKEKHWSKKIKGLKLHKIGLTGDEEEDEDDTQEAKPEQQEESPEDEDVEMTAEGEEGGEKEAKPKTKAKSDTLKTFTEEEIDEVDKENLQYEITIMEEKLNQIKPNMAAIKEYYKKEKEYLSRVADLDAITEERDAVRAKYDGLRKQRLDTFMEGFSIITMKLKEMYQMITLGGDAELELVDRLNPFSEGIVFSVRPPKKSWKNISNLSGGEKTLSSLALVFALHHFKPTPLYVMDEIDAALDFKNVSIVANYIKERTKNAQFIIISLRNNMFELADRLIGIYKTDNCTKSVTIDPSRIAEQAASLKAKPLQASAAANVAPQPQSVPAH